MLMHENDIVQEITSRGEVRAYISILVSASSNGSDYIIYLLDAITVSLQTMKEPHPTCRLLLAANSLNVITKCNCMHLVMCI